MAGSTTASEAQTVWWVSYKIELDARSLTRRAVVAARTNDDQVSTIVIEGDGQGHWMVDGRRLPELDGCLDVDLESSAFTNSLPIRRTSVAVGETLVAPAVYVRVAHLSVERLEQRYVRSADIENGPAFEYAAPVFDFACRIDYDWSGLVTRYPGIADRAG